MQRERHLSTPAAPTLHPPPTCYACNSQEAGTSSHERSAAPTLHSLARVAQIGRHPPPDGLYEVPSGYRGLSDARLGIQLEVVNVHTVRERHDVHLPRAHVQPTLCAPPFPFFGGRPPRAPTAAPPFPPHPLLAE